MLLTFTKLCQAKKFKRNSHLKVEEMIVWYLKWDISTTAVYDIKIHRTCVFSTWLRHWKYFIRIYNSTSAILSISSGTLSEDASY